MEISTFNSREYKYEKALFGIFVLLNLLPLFLFKIFPTLDGAAHLYNSTLIRNLLSGNDLLEQFYKFNSEPVPNWSGHMLLLLLNGFLPAWLAEKCIMILIIAGFPFAFRYLVFSIAPENRLFSYLSFPLTWSFAFYMGFYNFCIAIILMLVTLGYWIRKSAVNFRMSNTWLLFLLITTTYFSHIMIYGLLCFFLGIHVLFQTFMERGKWHESIWRKTTLYKIKLLTIVILPTFILALYYFISRPPSAEAGYLNYSELVHRLLSGNSFVVYNAGNEGIYTDKIIWLIVAGAFISIGYCFRNKIPGMVRKLFIENYWFWLLAIVKILYYVMPDSLKWTSYISSRLGLLVFIFGMLWIASLLYSRKTGFVIPVIAMILTAGPAINRLDAERTLSKTAIAAYEAADFIQPGKTVFPVNYNPDYMTGHFSNYLGAEKPLVIMENYECGLDYFPLTWNMDKVPNTLIGNTSCYDIPCAYWVFDSSHVDMEIDYIFMLGHQEASTDSCHQQLRKTVLESYKLVHKTEAYELFQLR